MHLICGMLKGKILRTVFEGQRQNPGFSALRALNDQRETMGYSRSLKNYPDYCGKKFQQLIRTYNKNLEMLFS